MSNITATVDNLFENQLTIVKFRESPEGWDESNPNDLSVWVDSKDLSNLNHEWLNWIEYHDYSEYESFDDYIEAFLDSTGITYGFLVPDLTFEL